MFVVAFWAGTGAVIVLVLMGKKGCPEIEVVEKKPTGISAVRMMVWRRNWEYVGVVRM